MHIFDILVIMDISKNNKYQVSLQKRNTMIYTTSLILSVFTLFTIISVVASHVHSEKTEKHTSEILRRVNSLAIALQK
jgi:hypothetical protein